MKIYLYVDDAEFDEITDPVKAALDEWLDGDQGKNLNATLVCPDFENPEAIPAVGSDDLGLVLETNKKFDLKEPLNFLNKLAREHELEFVVGRFDEHSGEPENVCYFGFEEGRPDLFEIGTYLGLKK